MLNQDNPYPIKNKQKYKILLYASCSLDKLQSEIQQHPSMQNSMFLVQNIQDSIKELLMREKKTHTEYLEGDQDKLLLIKQEIKDLKITSENQMNLQATKNLSGLIEIMVQNINNQNEDLQKIIQNVKIAKELGGITMHLLTQIINMNRQIQDLMKKQKKQQKMYNQITKKGSSYQMYLKTEINLEQIYRQQKFELLDFVLKNNEDREQVLNLDFIDLQKKYSDGNTIFEKCIIEQKYAQIRNYCFNQLKYVFDKKDFFKYCKEGNLQALYCCILQGIDINMKNDQNEHKLTAFLYACKYNKIKIVQMLIKVFQIDVNQTNNIGITGYMYCCIQNNVEIIKYLLECNVDTEKRSNEGITGFGMACIENNIEVIRFLVDYDINKNCKIINESTAYYYLSNNNQEIIKKYIQLKKIFKKMKNNNINNIQIIKVQIVTFFGV